MGLLAIRITMCLLIALQSVQPVLACDCEPNGCDDCGFNSWCEPCEQWFDELVEVSVDYAACECDEPLIYETEDQADCFISPPGPKPASPETTIAEPKIESPTPAFETPTPVVPTSPIAVPQPSTEVAPPANDLFPGPDQPAGDTTTEPGPEKKPQVDDLFKEPSAIAEPQPLPQSEPADPPSNSTDSLFVEPKRDTQQQPEQQPTDNVAPPETQQEPDTFDDLFGPAEKDPATEPKEEESPEPSDPFGQDELPSTKPTAISLASPESRNWTDTSQQQFTCQARLVSMTAENVVLESASSERIVVPISSLSDVDLAFVQEHVRTLRKVLAQESVATRLAASWSH